MVNSLVILAFDFGLLVLIATICGVCGFWFLLAFSSFLWGWYNIGLRRVFGLFVLIVSVVA